MRTRSAIIGLGTLLIAIVLATPAIFGHPTDDRSQSKEKKIKKLRPSEGSPVVFDTFQIEEWKDRGVDIVSLSGTLQIDPDTSPSELSIRWKIDHEAESYSAFFVDEEVFEQPLPTPISEGYTELQDIGGGGECPGDMCWLRDWSMKVIMEDPPNKDLTQTTMRTVWLEDGIDSYITGGTFHCWAWGSPVYWIRLACQGAVLDTSSSASGDYLNFLFGDPTEPTYAITFIDFRIANGIGLISWNIVKWGEFSNLLDGRLQTALSARLVCSG